MSAFAVKMIALVSMLIDHTGCMLAYLYKLSASQYLVMRSLGRIAFPLYAFLIVNGFEKTGSSTKYLSRLCAFAALSQIPFNFAPLRSSSVQPAETLFAFRTDAAFLAVFALLSAAFAVSVFRKRYLSLSAAALTACAVAGTSLSLGGMTLLGGKLNVFYTLACSLAAICVIDMLERRAEYRPADIAAAVLLATAVCALLLKNSDYGYTGLLLIAALYLFRHSRAIQAVSVVLWGAALYLPQGSARLGMTAAAALAAVPVLMYSGKVGRKTKAFYYAYPSHLILLGIIYRFA